MNTDVLARLVANPPRKVLDELAAVGVALTNTGRARPAVELHLAAGGIVRGSIASVAENGAIALVHVGGTQAAPSVAFVRVEQIAAIVVPDAQLLVRVPLDDAPAPSRIELARLAAARTDGLSTALGHAVTITLAEPLDDDGRRAIRMVLPLLGDVIVSLAADDLGKRALAEVATIELAAGTRDVSRTGAALVVRAPVTASEVWNHAALRSAIERVL